MYNCTYVICVDSTLIVNQAVDICKVYKKRSNKAISDRMTHGLINHIDTKAKCRHLKNGPVKVLCSRCLSAFIDWRYSQRSVGIFDPAL
jgi:hypothetical protein